jgi:hypothetical protein
MRGCRSTLVGVGVVLLLASCTSAPGPDIPSTATSQGVKTFHSPAGWALDAPSGWHVLPFESSVGIATARGVQVSNVELPSPSIAPGFPIQTSSRVLPRDGVSLIIATEHDPSDVQQPPPSPVSPPLTNGPWLEGDAPAGEPTLSLLWFSGNGQTFLASIKTGDKVSAADQAALSDIVASVRFDIGAT